jgi:4'-phosphopantetheinyl transferase
LATPAGREQFDPDRLDPAARAEWGRLHTSRRRADWEVSRALLQAHPLEADRHASISHAAGHAALALAPLPYRVGVDIEACRSRDFTRLARIAFPEEEADLVAACRDETSASELFYALWTLKEASAKALGLALTDALEACHFGALVQPGGPTRARLPVSGSWTARVYSPRTDLLLALVLVGPQANALLAAIYEWPGNTVADWPERYRFDSAAADSGP